MAALTNDKLNRQKAAHRAVRLEYPVAASAQIFAGALTGRNAGNARGLVAGDDFLGIAARREDNSGGGAGAKRIETESDHYIEVDIAGTSATDHGKAVYAPNDNVADLTLTKATNTAVGVLSQHISGTKHWMKVFSPGEAAYVKGIEARLAAAEAG